MKSFALQWTLFAVSVTIGVAAAAGISLLIVTKLLP